MDELRHRAQTLLDDPPLPPTPVAALRGRARRRRARHSAAAVVVVAVGCALVFAVAGGRASSPRVEITPTTLAPSVAIGAPTTFVSTRGEPLTPTLTVAVSDARTGRILRTLLSVPNGSTVTGTTIAPNDKVWVTVNRGPTMLGHVAGGDPQPHTCASTVFVIDARTGTSTTVLRGGDDELISDAQPSPSGDRVTYVHSGYATALPPTTVQVRNLATGAVVSIGTDLARCTSLRTPRWTRNGLDLVVLYAKALGPAYTGPAGTCSGSAPGELVRVSAEESQPGLAGVSTPPAAGCAIDAVAVTSTGYAAVEHCGTPFPADQLYINAAVRLVRYDADFRVVARTPLGQCEDGSSVAGDRRSATVVVSTYQFCAAAGQAQPVTKVFVDTGRGPAREIAALPGGSTAVDYVSF